MSEADATSVFDGAPLQLGKLPVVRDHLTYYEQLWRSG
jgi:hypothetical protein